MPNSLSEISTRYLNYLAARFPVMCASDEFHFVPRAAEANRYYGRLEDFDAGALEECVAALSEFRDEFESFHSVTEATLEEVIDLELLKASVSGVLQEFARTRSWRHNPLLYLKVAFIGLDHALTKPSESPQERLERSRSRLGAIPRLLRQGMENLGEVPQTYHLASLHMAEDCERFLFEVGHVVSHREGGLIPGLEKARFALRRFSDYLLSITPAADEEFRAPPVEIILKDQFRSLKTLPEVFEIAGAEWRECLGQLKELGKQIDGRKSWQEIYHTYMPEEVGDLDTLSLYRQEMESLKGFFEGRGFGEMNTPGLPEIRPTPTYLQSVRSSASFSAAFTKDDREKDLFYISTQLPERRSEESSELLRNRLHREYRFLTAHETFPGHFLLDSTRRRLANPIRAQIESPLFYEGWAYYVESLLTEYGYVKNPVEYLVDWKRRLWRAARCRIDVGLNTGLLSMEGAMELLTEAGFSREEAKHQIDRFRLNPGYQLCYSLGRHEIVRLAKIYGERMGREQFHRNLLTGGEIPFHLVEKRLEESLVDVCRIK